MKILLIEPPAGQKHSYSSGLGYLSAVLKRNKHQVRVLDFTVLNSSDNENILDRTIRAFSPGIVGFSIKSAQLLISKELVRKVKSINPEIKIIAGGPEVSIIQDEFLIDNPEFDFAFSGESEVSLIESVASPILSGYKNETSISEPGKKDNENPENKKLIQGKPVENLDSLPFPDFSSFIGLDFSKYPYPLLTSRGCPFNCIYCSVGNICGKKWRKRSPENVIEELRFIKKKIKPPSIDINDDNFTLDTDRAKRICELMLKEKINIPWQCHNGIRAKNLDHELARLMEKAGCWSVALGIETGNPETFNKIGKGETLEDIISAVRVLKKAKIRVGGYFIIGLPGETKEDVKKSIEFKNSLRLDFFTFGILVPYPGTKVFDWVKENGKFLEDYRKAKHFGLKISPMFESKKYLKNEMLESYILANVGEADKITSTIINLAIQKNINIKKGLVIRTLLADNLAEELKNKFPGLEISLLAEDVIETEYKYARVIPVRRGEIFELLKTVMSIRRGNYDLIIFITPERKGKLLCQFKILSYLTGAKLRIYLNEKREIEIMGTVPIKAEENRNYSNTFL